jgi:aspartyl-tRNA(Asn)/glutamyl-tRNA(Gln) amidotransferase subunit B
MPELPEAKRQRFSDEYGLSEYDARVLTESRARADFFEDVVSLMPGERSGRAKATANWMNGDFARLLNASGTDISTSKVTPNGLSELLDLIDSNTISGSTAKGVFETMFATGRTPSDIVQESELGQIESADEVGAAIARAIQAAPKAVEDYKRGKESALQFLLGQVMRETKGRARPDVVLESLREKLDAKA